MQKIVLAFDSFKGSASSTELAQAARFAIEKLLRDARVVVVPISDGGEGTIDVLKEAFDANTVVCNTVDPLFRDIEANYALSADGSVAIIELAAASGLTLLEEHERDPMKTSTLGTGVLIKEAIRRGASQIVLALGGSATNDAAIGIMVALGYKFLDKNEIELLPTGENLIKIAAIDARERLNELDEVSFLVACDVTTPMYGNNGAAHIFAPQKGASEHQVELLDQGLRNYARVVEQTTSIDVSRIVGGGAAGATAAGIFAFLHPELKSGIELILDALRFDEKLKDADLVITGEGKIDAQTATGKAPMGVLNRAKKQDIPVVAIAGQVEDCNEVRELGFSHICSINPPNTPLDEAMKTKNTLQNVEKTVASIISRAMECQAK